jgi:hypothetical protein
MTKGLVLACAWVGMNAALAVGPTARAGTDPPSFPAGRDEPARSASGPLALAAPAGDGGGTEANPCTGPGLAPEDCAGPPRCWAGVDYLLWWLKPVCLKPPTLTTGSPTDAVPGALGQPNTRLVLGDQKFEFPGASGVRPFAGVWLTTDRFLSAEAEGFLLERAAAGESFRSAGGSPASYLPFQDPGNNNQALPFSIPGVVNGSSAAVGSSRLWGAEADLVGHFCAPRGAWLLHAGLLAGVRYLDLEDRVQVTNVQSLVADPSAFSFGSDRFTTRNQFLGGQVGSRLGVSRGGWSLELTTKMALGGTHQVSDVAGQPLLGGTVFSPLLLPGPLLALSSNVGRQSANRITLVPEMALKLRYDLTRQVSLSLGYSALYWNKVLCPGDQMDSHVNVTELPFRGPPRGPGLPAPLFQHTDAFAQGVNAGVEFRY